MQTFSDNVINRPKCDICPKDFSSTNKRDTHRVNVHSHVEPFYSCTEDLCNKRFNYMHQLQNHVKSEHFMDYKCCGIDFVIKPNWVRHRQSRHATYDDKVKYGLLQKTAGENYLPKIYFVIDEHDSFCKVGWTKKPISQKLAALRTKFGENMRPCKSWDLSEKFEEEILVESLETAVHEYMQLQFKQRKLEYFYLPNAELDEKFIKDMIESIIQQHEEKSTPLIRSPVDKEHVPHASKKRKSEINLHPTEEQLKKRERNRKAYHDRKGQWLYCAHNGDNIVKIGETSNPPKKRLQTFYNKDSYYGKFYLIEVFPLGPEYKSSIKRRVLEKRVIQEMGQVFDPVAGTKEHFVCSDHVRVVSIIKNIIENKNL